MSKGSGRRPTQVSREEYERRWASAFGGRIPPTVDDLVGMSDEEFADWERRFLSHSALPQVDGHPGRTPDFLDGYSPTEGE